MMRQKNLKKKQLDFDIDKKNKKKVIEKNTFSKNAYSLSQKRPLTAKNGYYFIWGYHAVTAALSNPNRVVRTFYASTKTKEMALNLIQNATCKTDTDSLKLMILDVEKFSLSPDSSEKRVHQQLMIEVKPLEITDLTDILFATKHLRLVVLDQITDSRNIGAIIRSAKAFGCDAVIISKHNAPAENGILARAAAGALEDIPVIKVTNLKRTIETLKSNSICCIGLDASGSNNLNRFSLEPKLAIIMGSENSGMRRLTKEACDHVVKIPMQNEMESLNVSVASAIALYATQTSNH